MVLAAFIENPLAERLRVGDTVRVTYRGLLCDGTVVEDRGDIGVGGRQLIRVRVVGDDDTESGDIEVPAAEVELVR